MADERIRVAVKLVDPSTDANQAAVSATGAVLVDNEEFPVAAALTDTFANPTTTSVAAMLMGFDGTDWDRIYTIADGDVVAAAAKGFLSLGTDGTNYQVVSVDAAGQLQVDVVTLTPGTGATDLGKAIDDPVGATDTGVASLVERVDTPAAITPANGDYTTLSVDANGRLHVTDPNAGAGTPGTPVVDTPALANIAAGATSTATELRTLELGGNTQQLAGFELSSSVGFKWVLEQVDNDVATVRVRGGFARAGKHIIWTPPNKAYYNITFGATAGFDGWRLVVTNLDTSETADFYAVFYYED